jgi:adenylate kinase family enzyme
MERMREYHHRTAAVLDHYRDQGVPVLEVDGVGDVDAVFDRVRQAIKKLIVPKPRARGI